MKTICIWMLMLLGVIVSVGCSQVSGSDPNGTDETPIPLIRINTNGGTIVNEPKIPAQMEVILGEEMLLNTPIGIEYRGSTSARLFEKYSYGLETWDKDGEDTDVTIFDMPEEEDWILYGPYSDKTLFRNVLAYDLARILGHYAARTKFVELELNQEFLGTYVFMEKLKRDKNRLDLKDLDTDDITPDVVSGGYVLKIDKTSGDTSNDDWSGDAAYSEFLGFRSNFDVHGNTINYAPYGPKKGEETYFLYEDPAPEDITPEQKSYIQNYINEFENALLNDDFGTSTRTYTNYINLDSFVDFFLLNELSANPDAYRISTFMYKNRNGKLNMGPIWDFNIAWGNDSRSRTDAWIYMYNSYVPNDTWLVPFWWPRLMEDPMFRNAVKTRWNELRKNEFSQTSLHSMIDEYVAELEDTGTVDRNFERWPILGVQVAFNSYVGESYNDEVQYVKNWISQRLSWMDAQIADF